ncbi:FAD-dependent oxidoreductase [Saprospira sp. CCB-QB6]|uniref:NAD(P)/FAD-dependent oxidoreductase n=1 Tax=Saprospira sp. CCB-QB6 TaxID=3023936 RepID=UPI00234A4413|nr:FAD-dependent oxidoreductase [Saprospira sp. CCB-QB6]WCL81068.1 FAD-dependent oxidoreductase [Saprospira sp. CCB-QB6]
MPQLDYLILGQGLAGSLLADRLWQAGQKVALIDQGHQQASSQLAAGIMNPIAGRWFTKSWRMETLLPLAFAYYRELEERLDCPLLEEKAVAMLFRLPEIVNNWMARSTDPNLKLFISPDFDQAAYERSFGALAGGVEFSPAGRLNLPLFIERYRSYWQEQGQLLLEEAFDFEALELLENGVAYKSLQAKAIIFCEGAQVLQNPYFNALPFNPAKGEVLFVEILDYPFDGKMVKDGVFIIPLGDQLYWVGSTYEHEYESLAPTDTEKYRLLGQLEQLLEGHSFKLLDHQASARPIQRKRRPILGAHPKHPQLYILNGLGAKGSYLAPYCSAQLRDHLLQQQPLEAELDIADYLDYF